MSPRRGAGPAAWGRWRAWTARAVVLLAVAACAKEQSPASGPAAPGQGASGPTTVERSAFDREASDHFLEEAKVHLAAGDLAAAEDSFEASALLWPDQIEAWRGLAAAADARGDTPARAAAEFVEQRIYLFPSRSLGVQRDYRVALLAYIDEEEAAADANRLQLTYARALADYYAYRYAERGTYQPPELPFFDVRWEDAPAVAVTGILLLVYGFTVATS